VFSGDVGLERWIRAFFRPARSTWQDPAGGGGFAYGQLSHSVALLLWITGLRAASMSARCFMRNGIDLHDAATVTFDNGAVGAVFGGASVPEGGRARLRLSIAGSKGIADIDVDLDRCEFQMHDGISHSVAIAPGEWNYNCLGPVERLVDLSRGTGENLSPGEIGAKATEIIEALLRSARSDGQVIAI
jgi:predicted dehydrogenase